MISDVRIGFTAGAGIVGCAIRHLDCAIVDGVRVPSAINHVLLRVIYDEGMDFIFQSHGKNGVGICFTTDLKRAISDGKVFRYAEKSLGLTNQLNDLAVSRMKTFTGSGYDQWMIALYLAAFRFGLRKAPALNEDGRYTCNEAVLKDLNGLVPWATAVGKPTPEPLFMSAMECASPVYFRNHPAYPIDFW